MQVAESIRRERDWELDLQRIKQLNNHGLMLADLRMIGLANLSFKNEAAAEQFIANLPSSVADGAKERKPLLTATVRRLKPGEKPW